MILALAAGHVGAQDAAGQNHTVIIEYIAHACFRVTSPLVKQVLEEWAKVEANVRYLASHKQELSFATLPKKPDSDYFQAFTTCEDAGQNKRTREMTEQPGEERTALTGAGTESKRIDQEPDRVAPPLHVTPEMNAFLRRHDGYTVQVGRRSHAHEAIHQKQTADG